ncbi:MAG: type II toxin-antitoxin system VapC family toxin [Chloroflexota bacterium]|nr:type II toxin-antitoxin system VapC family toxin [Chloroflexota bacterium]
MRYLLDTHIWLWSLLAPENVKDAIARVLEDKENELFISPITVWETLVLAEKGRIELTPSPDEWIIEALKRSPIKEAALTHSIAIKSRRIELPHQDPADRFIAATAWENDLILITEDEKLQKATQIKLFKTS